MISASTVFVLGAGAGVDLNLPVGRGLANKIGRMADIRFDHSRSFVGNGDKRLFDAFWNRNPSEAANWHRAAIRIRDGIVLADSIDDFIEVHKNDPKIVHFGKAAIVKSILEAESSSNLITGGIAENSRPNFLQLEDTWPVKFFRSLARGTNPSEVFRNISFINFNYDRCLEYFLFHALQAFYGIDEHEAASLVKLVPIHHPYGKIAPLPFQEPIGSIEFGNSQYTNNYVEICSGVKTYSEQIDDYSTKLIRESVDAAETIVFLGFAFHKQNMELLTPHSVTTEKKIFATAHGISSEDCKVILISISRLLPKNSQRSVRRMEHVGVHLRNDLTCSQLFDNFRKTLSE